MNRSFSNAMRRLIEWEALEYYLAIGFTAEQAYDAVKHPIQLPTDGPPRHVNCRSIYPGLSAEEDSQDKPAA